MPKAAGEKRFNSALVPFVLALVRAAGGDPARLEKKYPRADVSLTELGQVLTDAAKTLEDPLFGLHAALAMPRGSYGLLEFALRCAPTGRKAMEQLSAFGALINPLVRWLVEVDGDEVLLHHRAPRKGGVGEQGNIFTVARILQTSREMLGQGLTPTRAWFAHEADGCPEELRAHLGLKPKQISFGRSSSGIAFKAVSLNEAPEGADPELNKALELHAAALLADQTDDEIYEKARRAVLELLPKGDASLARTAKALHLTGRTLQRRLSEEGVAFAALVAEVRKDQAQRLLSRTNASVAEIAERVGYSDAGAFTRAFRGWAGTTPGGFRAQSRA